MNARRATAARIARAEAAAELAALALLGGTPAELFDEEKRMANAPRRKRGRPAAVHEMPKADGEFARSPFAALTRHFTRRYAIPRAD